MTAYDTFDFAPHYTLRPARAQDYGLAKDWTAADPDHCDTTRPEFWLEQRHGRDAYLLLDSMGPVFFLKIHRTGHDAVELHIQFPPPKSRFDIARVSLGMVDGLEWLEGELSKAGIHAVTFDSHNDALMKFATKRLGFEKTSEYELVKAI